MTKDGFKTFQPESGMKLKENQFFLHGGCTMIFDLDSNELKYAVSKPLLDINVLPRKRQIDKERVEQQYNYQIEEGPLHLSEYNQYFGQGLHNNFNEPFCLLHH